MQIIPDLRAYVSAKHRNWTASLLTGPSRLDRLELWDRHSELSVRSAHVASQTQTAIAIHICYSHTTLPAQHIWPLRLPSAMLSECNSSISNEWWSQPTTANNHILKCWFNQHNMRTSSSITTYAIIMPLTKSPNQNHPQQTENEFICQARSESDCNLVEDS